jgi:hypothetical protein
MGPTLGEVEAFLVADLFELAVGTSRRRIYDGPGDRTVWVRLEGETVTSLKVDGPTGAHETDTPSLDWLDEVLP